MRKKRYGSVIKNSLPTKRINHISKRGIDENKFSLLILSIVLVSCSSTTQVVSSKSRPRSNSQYTTRAYTPSIKTGNNIIIYEANKLDSSSEQKLKKYCTKCEYKKCYRWSYVNKYTWLWCFHHF